MRPDILFPLAAPLTSLPGVGQKLAQLLAGLLGVDEEPPALPTIADLLWHLPSGLIDRTHRPKIAELTPDTERVTLAVTIGEHSPAPKIRKRLPYRVEAYDETGAITLTFFHARDDYMAKILPTGQLRFISGVIDFYRDQPQMVHPEHILTEKEFAEMPDIEPVYPLRAGITGRHFGKIMRAGLIKIPPLQEWDQSAKQEHHWPSWADAMKIAHAPKQPDDLSPLSPARARLAYDELLANQLALGLIRHWMRSLPARAFRKSTTLRDKTIAELPFTLTDGQKAALADIDIDMAASQRMLRLLQGDVGSGKTIVGFLSMLNAIETGAQAALMAPTEILVRQHGETLRPFCEQAGLRLIVLTSRETGKKRTELLNQIASGASDVVVGTHSLFQKDVIFSNLGLAVIDEQHRFGVHQRLRLSSKSSGGVDVLVMTATPIPRTLTLTAYGDMDVSRITQKPKGRKPITTRAIPASRMDEIIPAIERAASQGQLIYWVCPLIERGADDEAAPITAVKRHEFLSQKLKFKTGLIHGRMSANDQNHVLEQFQKGEISVLVATTIIEVGVDVPDATIMVIEHAERFGLAQLHQLRGRVGRSDKASSCLLVYREPLSEVARARLTALRTSDDGFHIAEEDLRLRGTGDILGTKQSGAPNFKLADPIHHGDLLAEANRKAHQILEANPHLSGDEGEALRILLHLFRREDVVHYPRSG